MQLAPNSLRALRSLAAGLSANGQCSRAAEILKRALATRAGRSHYVVSVWTARCRSGRTSDAMEKIRKAIELDPSLPEQSTSLADVLAKSGQPGPRPSRLARRSPHRSL